MNVPEGGRWRSRVPGACVGLDTGWTHYPNRGRRRLGDNCDRLQRIRVPCPLPSRLDRFGMQAHAERSHDFQ